MGEAAHIYGAKPGSARFDPGMTSQERRASPNAIWLCRNCHKIIDADEQRYSAVLLFRWREMHELSNSVELGKTNEKLRIELISDQFRAYGDIGLMARQILIDLPIGWEYRLTAEVLRFKCRPTLARWTSLKKGLYARQLKRVSGDDAIPWLADRMTEISSFIRAIVSICNTEFMDAWGEPGVIGSAEGIIGLCDLFAESCANLLVWEEAVRFTRLPEEYDEVCQLFQGVAGRAFEQVSVLPNEIAKMFRGDDIIQGLHAIELTVDLPPRWQADVETAIERLTAALGT